MVGAATLAASSHLHFVGERVDIWATHGAAYSRQLHRRPVVTTMPHPQSAPLAAPRLVSGLITAIQAAIVDLDPQRTRRDGWAARERCRLEGAALEQRFQHSERVRSESPTILSGGCWSIRLRR